MDRQTLRDWVIRFSDQGPDGLINIPSPGLPNNAPGVSRPHCGGRSDPGDPWRWRACDLFVRLWEEFRRSVSDNTIYRALKDLGFSHVSARPKAYKQDPEAMEAFKQPFPHGRRKSARSSRHAHR
jgi:transposase